jgi:hypothetical protein
MITTRELNTLRDFENLKKGDMVACEFHRNIHDHPKTYRFGVFKIFLNKSSHKEIILQKKNNIYFNYEMFLSGEGNLKQIMLIECDAES